MSNAQASAKIADQVLSMLFKHRQFTSGEITHMSKEMDDMRLEENLGKLLKTQENICRMDDQLQLKLDRCPALEIIQKLSDLNDTATKILQLGSSNPFCSNVRP